MIGTRIGNWILNSEIGTGSVGTVYRATNAEPKSENDPVVAAVKVLSHPLSRDPAFQARFPAEMLALRRLTHPTIARFYDSGVHAGLAYYATEFVEGTDAAKLLAKLDKVPEQPGLGWPTHFFRLAIQTAWALKHAHHRSILHRELKPSNLVVMADGSLKVTDFGVAKILNQPPLTLPADLMGTAGYLAPEHFTGKPLTRRSDLYALGGVLYTILTGRPPFQAATAAEFMHKHCYTLPDRPANFVPKLPHELDDFVCSLLAKDPNRRPASAAAILEELDQIRGKLERKGAKILLPPSPEDPTGLHAPLTEIPATATNADSDSRDSRAKAIRAGILGTLFLLVVGTILFVFFRPHPSPESLWSSAQPLVESDNPDDWDKARDEYLDPLSRWHPDWKGEEVRTAKQYLIERKELMRSFATAGRAKYTSEGERLYHRGLKFVQVSDLLEAKRTWESLIRVFSSVGAERRWVELAKQGLLELPRHPPVRANTSAVVEAIAQARKLRLTGQNAEADAMLKAIEELYRDQPDVLELAQGGSLTDSCLPSPEHSEPCPMANPTATVSDYCAVLTRSRLMPTSEVSAVAERWRYESKATDAEVDSFRKYLVSRRLLTEYQAAMVQRGHADGFYIGGYVILDRIGKGQMAGVYKAVHNTGQVVALKVLSTSKARNAHILSRFQREARLLTQLNHPNIVRAFQLSATTGENGAPGAHYIVMEHLEGETLDEVLTRRKKLPPPEAARLLLQALQGLSHLHEKRMVHRDLKPTNLMLVPSVLTKHDTTMASTLKILDIGLGREMFDDDSTSTQDLHLTAEGSLVGTPDYLAPEQARDARGSDIRADLYSLGCVLFAMLAGRPPFVEKSVMATMVKHATEPVPPITQFAPGTPPGLQSILNKMLEKDPARRYQTPLDAVAALRSFIPADSAEAMTTTVLPGFQEFLNSDEGDLSIPAALKAETKPSPPIRVNPDPPAPVPLPRPTAAPVEPHGAKNRPGGIASPTTAPAKSRANVSGPPSGKIKMGTGLAAALANAPSAANSAQPPSTLKPPSVGPRPSPLPPSGPVPIPTGEFDVELVSTPLTDPTDVLKARMADTPMRPLHDLDRRDFIMLSLGAGGVLAAIGLGLFVARMQGKKIQGGDDDEQQAGQP